VEGERNGMGRKGRGSDGRARERRGRASPQIFWPKTAPDLHKSI